ncbi:MAG TPA: hypothetical protein VLU99_08225 [Nitrososphaerales archaeon]|nr:hypothetical protein [Nitrososphaerales archaeon]HUK75765.1 hypothetical protein [Nitrososphaerales archaeon]
MAESQPSSAAAPRTEWGRLVALGVALVALLGIFLYAFGALGSSSTPTATTTTSTSYAVGASSVIAAVADSPPDGYTQGSSNQLSPRESGLLSAAYETFFTQAGSVANMTVLVFNSTQAAQTYTGSVINNTKDLSGYSDLTSSLVGYQHYGVCYGYGEADPDGNGAVATALCDKGNVYIQVHVISPVSLTSAEGDMSDLVGAAYQGTG